MTHPQFVLMTSIACLSQRDAHISQARAAALEHGRDERFADRKNADKRRMPLARQDNPNDTRAYALYPTPKGSEAVKIALPVVVLSRRLTKPPSTSLARKNRFSWNCRAGLPRRIDVYDGEATPAGEAVRRMSAPSAGLIV
jgi:hypothetical protein